MAVFLGFCSVDFLSLPFCVAKGVCGMRLRICVADRKKKRRPSTELQSKTMCVCGIQKGALRRRLTDRLIVAFSSNFSPKKLFFLLLVVLSR